MSPQGRKGREGPHGSDGAAEDPERLLIAAELAERPKSAAELVEATGLPSARVRRHIRQMREEGLIESIVRKRKRGTVEHYNMLLGALVNEEGELAELSLDERRRLYGNLLRIILTDATRALVTKPTDRGLERLDVAVVRAPIFTDEEGWTELAKLHRDFYDRVAEARDRIAERMAKDGDGDKGFKVSSVVMLFESETSG